METQERNNDQFLNQLPLDCIININYWGRKSQTLIIVGNFSFIELSVVEDDLNEYGKTRRRISFRFYSN